MDNPNNAAFCKSCGMSFKQSYQTCKNGHNYDAGLSACPFCPSADMSIGGVKTYVDNREDNRDKTIVDIGSPKLIPRNQGAGNSKADKTIIFSSNQSEEGVRQAPHAGLRKLIGWLVTYDINPVGIDYKLYVGRHRVGSRPDSDILIQQPGVSDEHAIILFRDNKITIQDMSSTNGTFVNGEMIEDKAVIQNDDMIQIGCVNLKLKVI